MADMSMRSIIEVLGLAHQFEIVETSKKYVCPFCGDPSRPKKKKLVINFKTNQFHCWGCQEGGSYIDFWALMRGMPKPRTKEDKIKIGRDYNQYIGAPERREVRERLRKAPKPKPIIEAQVADVDVRDRVYTAFLNSLHLSSRHKSDLITRGLTENAILEDGYKSAPQAATASIAHDLLQRGFPIEGVPGFYKKNGEWRFLYGRGFYIPVKDIQGRIKALQIRSDDSDEDIPKYLTISTVNKDHGAKGTAAPHFKLASKGYHTVVLTEGPLKGNIISHYTGFSTLCVLGVDNIAELSTMLWELKKKGTKYILIAFDMDMISNENVERAYKRVIRLISHAGFRFSKLEWPSEHKGLDDFLYIREVGKNK